MLFPKGLQLPVHCANLLIYILCLVSFLSQSQFTEMAPKETVRTAILAPSLFLRKTTEMPGLDKQAGSEPSMCSSALPLKTVESWENVKGFHHLSYKLQCLSIFQVSDDRRDPRAYHCFHNWAGSLGL